MITSKINRTFLKIHFTTYLLMLASFHCAAQLINTKPVDIYLGPLNFNAETVKKNKIKGLTISMVDKPDGAIIIDKGATEGFEFNLEGYVSRYYYTVLSRVLKEEIDVPAIKKKGRIIRPATTKMVNRYVNDTVFTNVYYDNQNRVISKRVRTGDYYDAWYYEYNEQGQIKKEMHCKETNISENRSEFKLGVQTILSSETFEYEKLTPTQIKKRCMNDEGREYKKGIIEYDEKGNKISEVYDFVVSWMHQENDYQYNSGGFLTKRIIITNESGEVKKESTYEYDATGLLLSEKKIKDKVVLNEISYLFDDGKLVKSHVDRDFKNSSIGIVKYSYTFY
jgi:hypothetical protein